MATIGQILAQIRTAIFGRDVRESIAEGIEKCYTDVQSASNTIGEAVTNANTASQTANAASQTANAAAAKIDGMTVAASSLPIGSNPTATISENATTHNKHIAFGIPRGATGVHYGTDEPTDPGVNVWIDPSGDGDSYVSESEFKKFSTQTAPSSDQLTSTIGETNTDLYTFRKTGGGANVGDREQLKKIIGGTVAWNQMAGTSNVSSQTSSDVSIVLNDNHSYTISGTASGRVSTPVNSFDRVNFIKNHKYLISMSKDTTPIRLRASTGITPYYITSSAVVNCTDDTNMYFYFDSLTDITGTVLDIRELFVNFFDLTQMFGSTIADTIYTMEQTTAGAGVTWFRKLFPKDYYAYDAGSLQSVQALSHKMRGFNQWDEEWEVGQYNLTNGEPVSQSTAIRSKNLIPVVSGATYCFEFPSGINGRAFWCDANGSMISTVGLTPNSIIVAPNQAQYIKFHTASGYGKTYNHDICINLSDPSKNGTYEPYKSITYTLGNSELRGIPTMTDGNLYYNGDTYEADGTVTRWYGIVDLGTLTWLYSSGLFRATVSTIKKPETQYDRNKGFVFSRYYMPDTQYAIAVDSMTDKCGLFYTNTDSLYIKNTDYTDAATFKTAMSGVYLVYELATPTTETTLPFSETQVCDPNGTEEFVDTRDVAIPVGHETFYPQNMREKLETIPSIIAPEEHTNNTTKDYNIGELFIFQNTLYKATEAIENGGEIKTGTGANCAPTTLAEELALAAGTSATGVSY